MKFKRIGTITLTRQSYLDLKLNFVKGCGYETYNGKQVEKEHKQETKVGEETEEEIEASVRLFSHKGNNILR